MVISEILEELRCSVPACDGSSDKELNWPGIVQNFAPKVLALGSSIVSSAQVLFGRSVTKNSTEGGIVTKDPMSVVAEYQLRPHNKYFRDLGKEIPAPENPSGPHATGIEISLSLSRAIQSKRCSIPESLNVSFQVWGQNERAAFGEMLRDYRRPIIKLLQGKGYEFSTAVPFENIDRSHSKDAVKLLELYYQKEHDAEGQFSISRAFGSTDRFSDLLRPAFPLILLYHCAEGYSQRKKSQDRLLGNFWLIENDKI